MEFERLFIKKLGSHPLGKVKSGDSEITSGRPTFDDFEIQDTIDGRNTFRESHSPRTEEVLPNLDDSSLGASHRPYASEGSAPLQVGGATVAGLLRSLERPQSIGETKFGTCSSIGETKFGTCSSIGTGETKFGTCSSIGTGSDKSSRGTTPSRHLPPLTPRGPPSSRSWNKGKTSEVTKARNAARDFLAKRGLAREDAIPVDVLFDCLPSGRVTLPSEASVVR
jgi:hypothetical protein